MRRTRRSTRWARRAIVIAVLGLFVALLGFLWLADPVECSQTVSHNAGGVSYRGPERCPGAARMATVVLVGLFMAGWVALLTWALRRRRRGDEAAVDVPLLPM